MKGNFHENCKEYDGSFWITLSCCLIGNFSMFLGVSFLFFFIVTYFWSPNVIEFRFLYVMLFFFLITIIAFIMDNYISYKKVREEYSTAAKMSYLEFKNCYIVNPKRLYFGAKDESFYYLYSNTSRDMSEFYTSSMVIPYSKTIIIPKSFIDFMRIRKYRKKLYKGALIQAEKQYEIDRNNALIRIKQNMLKDIDIILKESQDIINVKI